jgi:hypothetical protein
VTCCSYETPRATSSFPIASLEKYAICSDECCTWIFLQILRRKCAFHLATFVLRGVWANQHNSRQGCHLDELTNQSKLTRDLASAQGTRVIRKFARITAGVFEARHNHVGAKRCYGSKISKSWFIKITIGLPKPMRNGDMVRCLLVSQRSRKIYHVIQRNSRQLQG